MNRNTEITQALERFYAGETDPREELQLYLWLASQPPTSPFAADKALLEASLGLAGARQEQKAASVPIEPQKPEQAERTGRLKLLSGTGHKWAKYLAAAVVVLSIGLFTLSRRGDSALNRQGLQADVCYVNNVPVDQEQAQRITRRTIHRVAQCYQAGYRAQDEVQEHLGQVQESLHKSFYSRLPRYMRTAGYEP